MLHVTVVEGEGLTPGVDYVRRTDERIRIGIANDTDKSSIIFNFSPCLSIIGCSFIGFWST